VSCEQIDELLAAYSLDALDEADAADVRAHLAECRRHDVALAELRDLAERLPLAAPEREPPPELRARLLAAFEAEAAAPAPVPVSLEERRRQRVLVPAFAYLAAAALLLAVIGLATWNVVLQTGGDEGAARVELDLTGETGSGRLVYLPDEQVALVEMDVDAPPEGRAYQAWQIDESGPASLGIVANQGVTAFAADLSGAQVVAITEEPAGGSEQPTTQPFLSAELN
jgi:anti-sigma-K factor RskA